MIPNPQTYERISALQKFIRRGKEGEAGQVFFLLCEGGYFYWAVARLVVIAHEDIGLGDPDKALFALRAVDDAREMFKKKNEAWRLAAANAILALCRARKSREGDHFQAAMRGRNIENPLVLPEYIYDRHTQKGRKLGRGFQHFRDVGSLLVNGTPDQYEDEAFRFWLGQEEAGKYNGNGPDENGLFDEAEK